MRVATCWAGLLLSVAACAGHEQPPEGPSDEPPTATLGSAPPELTRAAEASFQFRADRSDASFLCALDQGDPVACVSPYVVVVPDGPHTLAIVAVAPGGQRSLPLSVSWTVDTQPPEAAIIAGPPVLSETSEAAFEFISTEAGSFQCRLDGGAYAACASGTRFTKLSRGEHMFQVKAIDKAGNEDPTPDSATWTVNLLTPETVIDEHPAESTTSTTATFSFAAAPGCTFECAVDESAFSPCNSPLTIGGLADGAHTFQARATSSDGVEDPTPASYTWTVDTTGPTTAITSGADGGLSGAAVTFTFVSEASAAFECALDGAFGACSGANHQDYADLTSGYHVFSVRAADALHNVGPVATRVFMVDPVRPSIHIYDFYGGPTRRPGDQINLLLSEPASLTCKLGDVVLSPSGGGQPTDEAYVFLPAVDDGPYTLTVTAIDAAGNVGTATRDIIMDETPPNVVIVSPVQDQLVGKTVTFQLSADEPVSRFQCRFDGEPTFEDCDPTSTRSFFFGGEHTIHVRAWDLGRNVSEEAVRHFSVDALAPEITILSPAEGQTTPRSGSIVFSVTENAATSCKLSGENEFTPCTSPLAFTLPNGTNTVSILATDAVGNTRIATRTWNVFTPVPTVTITAPQQSSLTPGSVSFQFTADKPVSEYRCRLDDEPGYTSCTPGLTRTLSTGFHVMRIHAIDLAGIDGPDAVRTWNVDADRTFVEIDITNTCLAFVGPDLTIPAGQTVKLRFRNNSEDYPVQNLRWFRGGSSFGSLAPGQSVAPNVTFCTVRGDDWVDISTPCSASPLRFFIHCLE